ncbi:D-methionine transport system substrate-binding protein [Streptosporangium becharense]|uniref:Lipoprotein n=1 Tax=Streptosporangium becharense TaxID=1816182 RepID=A0A7W9MIM7_9ACTN|nr:MetQ/NlpA family ABC transporter substrate-binding protein [Streptosporangium becharense]MBB2911333.1 D-methionine transport system substrate-binding protein [Streptosporangium becharense]MBB5821609.1 D-methionine transport system substrate-binding protein [Streptosporangium becharense]
MRKFLGVVTGLVLAGTLAACGGASTDATQAGSATPAADAPIKVGVNPVPHGEVLKYVKDNLAAKAGLNLEIVEFTDYVQPNTQLDEGNLDANYFQHIPYLEEFSKGKGITLSWVAPVHIEPLGLYSKKIKSIGELAQGAQVALPNDASNLGRSLKLLADNGVITLKEGVGVKATERDVAGNPKELKFQPLEAAQLPRSLEDVDAAVINGNYALESGLQPATDSLLLEKGENNPYANGLVTVPAKVGDPRVKKLAEVLQGPEVKKFIEDKYKGAVLPAQ